MAFCQVCGKTKQYGHNVSHSKRRTKRVFMPNVFGKKMQVDGEVKRIKICAKCLKRAKKFGEVKAGKTAVLAGMLVKVVDWQNVARTKLEEDKREKKEEKKVEVKKEVSVEELVGKSK